MKQKIKKSFRTCCGVLLIIGGIIGLFLPLLQGIGMIIAGIFLISPEKGKKLTDYCKQRWKNFKLK